MEVLSSVVESFKCHECSFTCEERYSFLSHFFNHHVNPLDAFNEQSKQGFTCAICLSLFEDVEKLRQHYIVIHNYQSTTDETPVKHKVPASTPPAVVAEPTTAGTSASVDDPASNKPANLEFNAFKEKLTSEFIHKCTKKKCKLKFPTVEQRDQHTQCHTAEGSEYLFKCFACPGNNESCFKKWIECCMHLWKSHQCDVGLLKCPLCNYRSQISVKVFRHLQTHSEMKEFACTVCEKPRYFAQESQLKRHMESIHESTEPDANKKVRWYSQKTCEICQHVFANSKTLSKHIKQVHNKIKPFICKVCGYKAARKATITIHERQHTGERPLSCKVENCDFRAADPSVLVKHMKKHDTGNSSTNYQCPKCDYTTIQAPALKNHIRAKHEDFYPQIKCDQCNFTSINEKTLNLHKLDHKAGLIEDSNQSEASSIDKQILQRDNKHNISCEISSDCFLPLESTDSITHDTGGVTIPHHTTTSAAAHSEDTQFPN
ncbi:zinc finger protein 728 [Culicoides brevitarsis]|uniref:zinc finger protein 728 n=1 Tax=Culicoides brevitarsis TaxID=469753 RepID=UPI00307C8A91